MIGDLFNYGHLKALEKARQVSDLHICGVISDEVARKWTSPLVCSYEERKAVIERIDCVDEVWLQDSLDPTGNLKKINELHPDATIVLMQSHHLWQMALGAEYIREVGGETVKTDFYHSLSRDYMVKLFFRFFTEHASAASDRFNELRIADLNVYDNMFSTKADTLASLRSVLKNAVIERLFVFTVGQWRSDGGGVLKALQEQFGNCRLVVRSSSRGEDALESSNAGCFYSELNLSSGDPDSVRQAVDRVVASYSKGGDVEDDEQILVQAQTENVEASGVVFTRNLESNTPYYLINYDDSSARTDTVTGGIAAGKLEIFRGADIGPLERRWQNLLDAVREIEEFFQGISLDIEFAVKADSSVVIFQVRPLAANSKFYSLSDDRLGERIGRCIARYRDLAAGESHRLILSDMAFWNPAELIGNRTDYLSYSLFNHLIMKSGWNEALRPLGYAAVEEGLMVRLANKPYVHVPRAFRSLLPASLPEGLASRLLDHYLDRLGERPELHDKIEFEIVHNCYTFDLAERLLELTDYGFTQDDLRILSESLRGLTVGMISSFERIVEEDSASIAELAAICDVADKAALLESDWRGRLKLVCELMESCRRLGIPPFVRVARAAFVSGSLLRSLVRTGELTADDVAMLMNSVETVATEVDRDMDRLVAGDLTIDKFMARYGHLRPGTYDITKFPYNLNPAYLSAATGKAHAPSSPEQAEPGDIEKRLDAACLAHSFPFDGRFLLAFIRRTIQLREYFKFVYSRSISRSLELIAEAGEGFGFGRNELARLDFGVITGALDGSSREELVDSWRCMISGRLEEDWLNGLVSLPSLVLCEQDFMVVRHRTASPNFVTEQTVEADVAPLDRAAFDDNDITGKIVVLEKADPGYDWIFTKGIAGLVTKYGGAASHMAIRAAEFGIPAAIGCGEIIFGRVSNARRLVMDCKNRLIHPI